MLRVPEMASWKSAAFGAVIALLAAAPGIPAATCNFVALPAGGGVSGAIATDGSVGFGQMFLCLSDARYCVQSNAVNLPVTSNFPSGIVQALQSGVQVVATAAILAAPLLPLCRC